MGGKECLQWQAAFHILIWLLGDWLMVAPEWAGPGSQGLPLTPGAETGPGRCQPGAPQDHPAAKHFKSLLPIQPKFQLNGHRGEGGATAIKTGCKRKRICFQNVFAPLPLASKTSGLCLWSRANFFWGTLKRREGCGIGVGGGGWGHGALSV